MRPGNSGSVKIWRLATIIQVSSLHACVDNFHPPGAGDATEPLIPCYKHGYGS